MFLKTYFYFRFMPDTFKDITAVCGRDGKFPMFLDVSTPAINLRYIYRKIHKTLEYEDDITAI